ncbi:MAG: signal recognition particle-docking protein FtsY [Burkholderiaceae bacterium]|jgi:fused signal recognition particle receptor
MRGFLDRIGLSKLGAGLSKTRAQISQLFGGAQLDDDWFEEVESALIMADVGARASQAIVKDLRDSLRKEPLPVGDDPKAVRGRLADILASRLERLQRPQLNDSQAARSSPRVVMLVGVNGAGKTTTIGKLTHFETQRGNKVLLAAGDTFRAAAREQLLTWGSRNSVDVIAPTGQADPAAIAFDAVSAGLARQVDCVIVDTAGRLPTQLHLMEELKKVKRVMAKAMAQAPHETWLVVDGGTGQNALAQVKAFHEALGLTGLVVTKLDGTAKGGVLLALAEQQPIPVAFIGVGEGLEDLQPFDAQAFAQALIEAPELP